MWVLDATPLIYLAKVDRLDLVQHLDGSCVIPDRVYEEVIETGIEQGNPDAVVSSVVLGMICSM
ncbi:hypothetical protein NDI76_20255 [Halogeometricum sp. S1BR25-6]|uniref:Uncharacterized protein n=1 Tax=Halogeometricum salsisoli TaxID=2950536 RepID=A0ABU2GJT3_9EURY|nr:hypothetical protein [Halogeometricum sp. S1BR25-6]MDS0301075.1 hypothetical protein [Halogeometricum sp. S1BR25-6]